MSIRGMIALPRHFIQSDMTLPFPFGTTILVPSLDLRLGQIESLCHVCAVGHTQILLHSKAALQEA